MEIFWILLIPFLGTMLGAGTVFLMKNKINKKIEKLLLGFASGVMIAASIWSLIQPSINMAEEQGKVAEQYGTKDKFIKEKGDFYYAEQQF